MLRRALWALVTVVAVLGMHAAVLSVGATSPAMAGMAVSAPVAAVAPGALVAPTNASLARDAPAAPGAPSAPMPGGGDHQTMAAACAAILSALGLALLVAPLRARSSPVQSTRTALKVLAQARADRWPVGVPISMTLCVCRT